MTTGFSNIYVRPVSTQYRTFYNILYFLYFIICFTYNDLYAYRYTLRKCCALSFAAHAFISGEVPTVISYLYP